MADNVRRLLDGLPRLADAADLGAAVGELIEAAKVGRVGAKAWPDPSVYGPIKEALEEFREELRGRGLERFDAPDGGTEEAAAVGQRFLRVAAAAARAYRDRKRAHGLVDFQDLLLAARDLLRDRPDVRARVQDRYRFVLIDELQDTDPVQVELVESLCGGGLTAGKLFAVGDRKQSIYRFRGADVRLFEELSGRVPHEGRQGLTVNFRSQPAVLDFTNALLARRLAGYEPLVAHEPQVNPGPCVEFLWSPRPEKASAAEARAAEAEWIAARVAAMVGPDCPERLVVDREGSPGRLRRARPGDIVLLFRALSNVHLYEAALRRRGLHYYLVGGRAFFAQQEVYDLLNLLRALENPQDAVSLAGTLRSPFCCLSDEALFVLARHPGGLWAGLLDPTRDGRLPAGQRGRVARARRRLPRWRGLKDRVPIARLLRAVFADSGFDAATQFEFLGDRKLANLWKLLDLARTFDRSGLFGLAEFIARLGDLVRTQPREEQAATQPENADVVRLMTIHQAKGLEFPVVIVPDFAAGGGGPARPVAEWDAELGCVARPPADEDEPPFADFGWGLWEARGDVEDWHEDLRTLYVACTRARDYLVLSAALPDGLPATNTWMLTLAERFDPATGHCLDSDVPPERRPLVRVHDRDRPPPAPPRAESDSAQAANGAEEDDGQAAAPIVPWPPDRACVTVSELHRFCDPAGVTDSNGAWSVRDGYSAPRAPRPVADAPGSDGSSPYDDLSPWTLDAEDGSGLSEWLTPRERLTGRAPSACERLVRAVLTLWDFRDRDGWRPVLRQLFAAGVAADAVPGEAEAILERFAGSARARELAEAPAVQREVEFHLDLREMAGGDPDLPVVRGLVDCLWRDAQGGWQLLGFALDAGQEAEWGTLLLAAEALRRQTGVCPAAVTLYDLAGSKVAREARDADGRLLADRVSRLRGRGRPRPGR
jgi:superfamily I DNA/RNA helicase